MVARQAEQGVSAAPPGPWAALLTAPADRSPTVGPSGAVAYITVQPDSVPCLMIAESDAPSAAEPRRLFDVDADVAPAWSPDGAALAALGSDRRIAVWNRRTDTVTVVTSTPGERVVDLMWSDDQTAVVAIVAALSADTSVATGSIRRFESGHPAVRTGRAPARRLVEVPLDDAPVRPVDTDGLSVWEATPLGAGEYGVIASVDATENGWYRSKVYRVGRRGAELVYDPPFQVAMPSFDGQRQLAVVEGWASDRGHVAGDACVIDLEQRTATRWAIDGVDLVRLRWANPDELDFSGWSGTTSACGTSSVGGANVDLHVHRHVHRERDRHGAVAAAVRHVAGLPPVIAIERDDVPERDVIVERGDLPTIDDVEWQAADGTTIQGLLVGGDPARRLVVLVHGGPANLWNRAVPPGALALHEAGYSVLLPNPRGSVGRGQRYARANLGDPGGAELGDVLSGAAMCRHDGRVADLDVGVIGGSYGGYLTSCAVANRIGVAAAVVMYGHPDLLSARYGSNNPAFYDLLLGGPPHAGRADLYLERSPVLHIGADTAPTLILHGALDACTPLGQGEEFFMALREQDVATEFVVYPDEGHGLKSLDAQIDAWRRAADWFHEHAPAVVA